MFRRALTPNLWGPDDVRGMPARLRREVERVRDHWDLRDGALGLESESLSLDMAAGSGFSPDRTHWPGVVARLCGLHGVTGATRVLAAAGASLFHRAGVDQPWALATGQPSVGAEAAAFHALRAALVSIEEREFEAAKDVARSLARGARPRLQAKLAFAFMDAARASAVCVAELERLGAKSVLEADLISLLSVIDDPELSLRLTQEACTRIATLGTVPYHDASRGPFEPYAAYRLKGAARYAFDMAEVLGDDALPALRTLLDAALKDREIDVAGRRRVAQAIAVFETDAAAATLAPHVGRKGLEKITTSYFREHPRLAHQHLGPRAKRRSRAGKLARTLLEEAAQRLAEPTSAEGRDGEGEECNLPLVLERPPWRHRRRHPDLGDAFLEALPDKPPRLRRWVQLDALPAPRTRGGAPLPERAVKHLLEMLMFTPLRDPYAGVASVRDACDPSSLGAFSLALFRLWQTSQPELDRPWPAHALALLGGPDALEPLLEELDRRAWASEPGWAELALRALSELREPYAEYRFLGLPRVSPQRWVATRAGQMAAERAAARGVPLDSLRRTSLPRLGFDERGNQTFDLGSRTLTLSLQSEGEAELFESGRPLGRWPSARKGDDTAAYERARGRHRDVLKRLSVVRGQLVRELETALRIDARWLASELREELSHPIARTVLRRLLFARVDDADTGPLAFRITDDGLFSNIEDEPLELSPDAMVGLAHPLELDPEVLAAWTDIWADYELLPPFAQLQRRVFERGDEELADGPEERLLGWTWDPRGLERLYRRGFTVPAGTTRTGQVVSLQRRVGRLTVQLVFDPPLREREGWGAELAEVTLFETSVSRPAPWSTLSPREYSELIHDLLDIRADTSE